MSTFPVSALSLAPDLRPERPEDAAVADRLVDAVFGPGRFVKSAERLREGGRFLADLSFVAWEAGEAVGSVRLWPIRIGETPALLLGPIAVASHARSRGLGAALVEAACEAAAAAGHGIVLLVGDAAYFERAGFTPAPPGDAVMPGPADPRRVMWRALKPGALAGVAGAVKRD